MPASAIGSEFCLGPQDDPTLVSGTGPGVEDVVRRTSDTDGEATFIFDPAAVPAGKQLFIDYLNAAQLEVTGGTPGSGERLFGRSRFQRPFRSDM